MFGCHGVVYGCVESFPAFLIFDGFDLRYFFLFVSGECRKGNSVKKSTGGKKCIEIIITWKKYFQTFLEEQS